MSDARVPPLRGAGEAARPPWMDKLFWVDETATKYVRVLVYGDQGTGKTRFLATAGKVFVIDTDKGARTLKSLHIPAVSFSRGDRYVYKQIMDLLDRLKKAQPPFDEGGEIGPVDTFSIDGLTALADVLIYEIMKWGSRGSRDPSEEKPQWDDYSVLKARLQSIVQASQDLPCNVIMTANSKLDKDDQTGRMYGVPDILGGFRDAVGRMFDEVYYLDTKRSQNGTKYMLYTRPYDRYKAKSRDDLPDEIEDPSFEKIFGHPASEPGADTRTGRNE